MFRRSVLLITLLLLATACTLTREPESPESTVDPDDEIGQIVTETPTATPTPTQTQTPTPTPTATSTSAPVVILPNCTVRTTWPIYVVASGDTLASIARRTSSTVSELTTANCLSNPNIINPGQQLRVPRQPVQPNPDTYLGAIRVSPYVTAEGGAYSVQPNTTITITWPEARRDALRVEFRGLPAGGGTSTLLGIDTYPADGATVLTSFATNFGQFISAIAYLSDGSRQLTANSIYVTTLHTDPPGPRVQGEVIVSPYLRIENGVRIVEAGQTVTLLWQGAPVNEGTDFEFILIEEGVVGPQSLGIDNNGADGVSVPWTVPHALNNARIVASTRLPGQTHEGIDSRSVYVAAEEVLPGTTGQLTVSPIIREDGGWMVLPAGEMVTISWVSPPAGNVSHVEFYLAPTGTGITPELIGSDDNLADGASMVWEVPPPFSAHVLAKAFTTDGRTIQPDNILQLTSE